MRPVALCLGAVLLITSCGGDQSRVVVAAGTTVTDSGFMDALVTRFQEDHPRLQLSVMPNSTALILELGRQGSADLLITHAPDQEAVFVDEGYSARSELVFTSRFVLVGPPSLRDRFQGLEIPEVLRTIASEGIAFVSRGDGSGTNDAEIAAWLESGVDPSGQPWYMETGDGMGPTLLVADQRDAVTIAEYGAFVAAADVLHLIDLGVAAEGLENPYHGIVVSGSPGVNGAGAFLDWLMSSAGRTAIDEVNREMFGQVIYAPAATG